MPRLPSQRARWLAQNIVPHERGIRVWLSRRCFDLDVDDIIQEMYARIASLDSVDEIRNPRQYATQAAFSILANQLRHSRIVPMIPISDFDDDKLGAWDEATPEERISMRDDIHQIYAALSELPHRCRQAFLLRRVDGFSQKEVAARLGISEKTVEKYMAQGVRCLIRAFGRGGKRSSELSQGAGRKVIPERRRQ